jgi:predicted PurR-regulated permease PerM
MDRKKNLETCLVIVTGLLIFYLIKNWSPLLIAAILIGCIGVFLDKPASWITWLWYKFSDILGKVLPKIILLVIFYIFLFPIALLSKLSNKNRQRLNGRKLNSMWINREYSFTKEDLRNPW